MPRTMPITLVLALAISPALTAASHPGADQVMQLPSGGLKVSPLSGPTCTGGVTLDDGSFESGLRIPFASDARYVQKLTPASYPARLERACVTWKTGFDPAAMSFNVVFYDDDGPSGQPGTLLGSSPSAVSIPTGFGQSWVGVECADANVVIAGGAVYVGVHWNSGSNADFFIATDESASTPTTEMYNSSNGGLSWTPVTFQAAGARALGIRANFSPVEEPEPEYDCTPDDDTMCLNGGRHKLEMQWTPRNGTASAGKVLEFDSVNSGLFYFTDPNNVELLIKVLDGCALNQRWWVFFAGATDVQIDLTVTDLETGAVKAYHNPQRHPANAVTDTSAFACQ